MGLHIKNLLIKIPIHIAESEEFWLKVLSFMQGRDIANGMITKDGQMLLSSTKKKIDLNSGMTTLQKCLKLDFTPIRITNYLVLPNDFLKDYFKDGYNKAKILQRIGPMFEDAALNILVDTEVGRRINEIRNHMIETSTTKQLLKSGELSYEKAALIHNNKKLIERIYRQECLKPDLDGDYVIQFEQWAPSSDSCVFVRTGRFPPVKLTIRGRPRAKDVKLKHYYIYSKLPGFGKTFAMERFKEQYNAHFVTDMNNWLTIPSKAQFLIFEEVSVHKKLGISDLKTLTSGSASGFYGNCKTHGESFEPRSDVQVIMLSNEPIYKVYSKYDFKMQRRFADTHLIQQLHQRFHIVCLDGSWKDDFQLFTEPSFWTQEQFEWEVASVFKPLRHNGGSRMEKKTTKDKIIGLMKYINRVQQLLEVKFEFTEPDMNTRGTLLEILSHPNYCDVPKLCHLNLSWFELITELYTIENHKKTGKPLAFALDKLVDIDNDNNPLDCQVVKKVTLPEMRYIYYLAYEDISNGVDIKKALKRGWATISPEVPFAKICCTDFH